MKLFDTINFIIIAILLVIIVYLYWRGESVSPKPIYKYDTVVIKEPIIIEKEGTIKYRWKVKYDTLFVLDTLKILENKEIDSTSFVSCIDTNVNKTDVRVCYMYPENKFNVDLFFHPDTVTKYIYIEKSLLNYKPQESKWYEDVYKIGGGMLIGVLIGRAIK